MIRVNNVSPFRQWNGVSRFDIRSGEIAVHFHMRWASIVHDHFALRLLVSPCDDFAVRLFCAEPSFGGMVIGSCRVVGDTLPAEQTLPPSQMSCLADDSAHYLRANIFRLERSDLVLDRFAEVPHAEVAVRLIEDSPAR